MLSITARSSFAHGSPPAIQSRYYDVPLPLVTSSGFDFLAAEDEPMQCFIYFCRLTQILAKALPFVYTLHADQTQTQRSIKQLECAADGWEESLPSCLQVKNSDLQGIFHGASHLWFCYLSLRLLISRLSFKVGRRSVEIADAG